jgi:hypothetical protein
MRTMIPDTVGETDRQQAEISYVHLIYKHKGHFMNNPSWKPKKGFLMAMLQHMMNVIICDVNIIITNVCRIKLHCLF